MYNKFTIIQPENITKNFIQLIGNEWMLITSGPMENFNTMTASWGAMGVLWHKPVAIIFIRPQRHTYEFVEKNTEFTLTFFPGEHKEKLKYCGTHSGRDTDKIKNTGLVPVITERGNVIFEQAKLAIECKKIFYTDIKPGNILYDEFIDLYPTKDFHRIFVGEILQCLKR